MVNICNNLPMPIFEGKRLEFVGVKFNQDEKGVLEEIAKKLDRPLSYVVRELALRGFVQYLQDGNLKNTDEEIAFARQAVSKHDWTQPDKTGGLLKGNATKITEE